MIRVSNLKVSPLTTKVEGLTPSDGLTSGVVQSLFEDREGNVWVGTQNGLNRLSEVSVVTTQTESAPTEAVRSVTSAKDGSIWVRTSNGLFRLSGASRTRFDERDGLPNVAVGALHSDSRGVLWVASDWGVSRFKDGRFFTVFDPLRANLKLVETLTTDLEGGLWFTDNAQGVFRWKDDKLESFDDVPEVRGKLGTYAITDRQGRVWMGFADGSLVVYPGKFRAYSREQGLPGGSVASISEDSAGTIWVGTTGLSRFEHERFVSLTSRSGLPVNNVNSIVEDARGDIWFGVTSGIIRLKRDEFDKAVADTTYRPPFIIYDMSDGLPGVPMSVRGRPTVAQGPEGILWFVTTNGLAVIDPRQPKKRRLSPPVHVERIIADERPLDIVPQLELPALTSSVQIVVTPD